MLIRSTDNPAVKRLEKLRLKQKERESSGTFLAVGKKMIDEIPSSLSIKTLVVEENHKGPKKTAELTLTVSKAVMKKITGQESPEGIAAEVNFPALSLPTSIHRLLILDRIQDPGNIGTLLRTALAFGWDGAYILEGSCDPYNEKSLRASMGAIYRLPILQGNRETCLKWIKEKSLTLLAADLTGDTPQAVNRKEPVALVIGSESLGVDPKIKTLSKKISIPMRREVESLNAAVAGGILLYLI